MKDITTLQEGQASLLESLAKLIKSAEALGMNEFTVARMNKNLENIKNGKELN